MASVAGTGSLSSFHQSEEGAGGLLRPGQEDDLFDDTRALTTGYFGVLYAVGKEKNRVSYVFAGFRLLFDWLQLYLLILNPQYGFDIDTSQLLWRIFSFVQLNAFMQVRGFAFFLGCMYIFVIGLVFNMGLCIWVGYSFQNNRFDHIWPIAFLRYFSLIFYQVLDIASMTLFLMALDCQYFSVPPEQKGINQEFGFDCWRMPNLIHIMVASVSFVVFTCLAAGFQMAEMELNLVSKNILAMAHSKVEVYGYLLKTIMTCASVFINSIKWMSVVQLTMSALLLWLYLVWEPHYYRATNNIRVATYASIFYGAIVLVVLAFMPGIDQSNDDLVNRFQKLMTNVLYIGTPISFGMGWLASYFRFCYMDKILLKLRHANDNSDGKDVYVFSDARQVEILMRCCRKWVDRNNLEEKAVELAKKVMKFGLAQLPKSPYMIILHASYLIELQNSYQSGYTLLQAAKKADPSFLERYGIFCREQQHTQKSSGAAGGDQAMDLVSYVEFQRNYGLVKRVHKDALLAVRYFWQCLLHSNVPFDVLSNAVKRMDLAIKQADRVYRTVLQRHSSHVKMVRLYAKFLEHVKHDPWTASNWYSEAEKLDKQDEEGKHSSMFGDLDLTQPGLRAALSTRGPGGSGHACAVVVMNAMSVIQMTNGACFELFGYSKNELRGKRVDIFIPPPFCEQHHGHVRTHVTTGKQVVLGRSVPQIALHKDGHLIPMKLSVSRISGVGEDAVYMGLMEVVLPEPDTATVWVNHTGNVISVDPVFSDWFGYRPEEVAGSAATLLIVQSKQMEELLKVAKQARNSRDALLAQQYSNVQDGPIDTNIQRKLSMLALDRNSATGAFDARAVSYSSGAAYKANVSSNPNLLLVAQTPSTRPSLATVFAQTNAQGGANSTQGQLQAMAMSMGEQTNMSEPGTLNDEPQWRLAKVNMHHKYADPEEVEITCANGGTASFQFYAMTVRRLGVPSRACHMMVTDPQGRICHVTEGLAEALASSSKVLMANGAPNALQALMPEPFRQLHNTLAQSIPMLAPPCYSCRSGLSILLNTSGPPGPYPVPFKIKMKKRTALDGVVHVLTLEDRTMEQALDERRLVITLDGSGTVKRLGRCHTSLFGFHPSTLVGKHVSAFVDILRAPDHMDIDPNRLLMELLARCTFSPGTSWRVGVRAPLDEVDTFSLGALASTILAQKTRPAIMMVQVHLDVNHGAAAFQNIELEVQLWRAELATAVLELDFAGKILPPADENALYPAGQLFGVSEESMVGRRIHDYLPLGKGAKVAELFEPNRFQSVKHRLSAGAASAARASHMKRSSLKPSDNSKDGPFRTGPVQAVRTTHLTDGADLELTVQAVRKAGGYYLVMHPLRPKLGRPDFADWILGQAGHQQQQQQQQQQQPGAEGSSPRVPAAILPRNPVLSLLRQNSDVVLPPSRERPTLSEAPNAAQPGTDLGVAAAGQPGMKRVFRSDSAEDALSPNIPAMTDEPMDLIAMLAAVPTPPAVPPGLPSSDSLNRRLRGVRFGGGNGAEPDHSDAEHIRSQLSILMPEPTIAPDMTTGEPHTTGTSAANAPGEGTEAGHRESRSGRRSRRSSMDIMKKCDPAQQDLIKAWILSNGVSYSTIPSPLHTSLPHHRLDALHAFKHQDSDGESADGHSAGGAENGDDDPNTNQNEDRDGSKGADSDDESHHAGASEVDLGSKFGASDYQRGRRFKKLLRTLGSAMVQHSMTRFRNHSIALVTGLLALHLGMFILMYVLIKNQSQAVQELNNIGLGAVACSQLAVTTRDFNILYGVNLTQPNLPLLTGPSDIEPMRALYKQQIDTFLELHTGIYLGFSSRRRLPKNYGIRTLWEKPSLLEANFFNVPYNESRANFTVMSRRNITSLVSLWDAGNHLASSAHDLWQNVEYWNASGLELGQLPDLLSIVTNAPNAVILGYLTTMDDMVQLVVDNAASVNNVQLMLLALEGCVVCLFITTYVWILSTQVAHQRFDVYSVFVAVPITLIRTLATKRLNISSASDDEDDDDDDVEPTALHANASLLKDAAAGKPKERDREREKEKKEEQQHAHPDQGNIDTPHIQIHVSAPKVVNLGFFARLAQLMHMGSMRNKVVSTGKRQLDRSHRTSAWLTWLFLLWGALIIISNAVGYTMVGGISGPIALFNIVNFVTVLYHRNMFYIQELVFQPDPSVMDALRADTVQRVDELRKQYNTMLYGHEAYPNETSPHFVLVSQGITYSAGRGSDILFYTNDCLCLDSKDCQTENNTYYEMTHHGLDRMMQKYLEIGDSIDKFHYLDPFLNGPEFEYYWVTRPDMTGGLSALNSAFHDTVVSVYSSALSIHMASFVLTWVMMLSWLFLIMRPFLQQGANETRRIAELLSQLPPEVDVEGLLNRTLLQPKDMPVNKLADKATTGKDSKGAGNESIQPSMAHQDSFAAVLTAKWQ